MAACGGDPSAARRSARRVAGRGLRVRARRTAHHRSALAPPKPWGSRRAPAGLVTALALGCGRAAVAAGAAGCDLARPEFAALLDRTRLYYSTGLFDILDAQRVAKILADRESLLQTCAAAVLQAVLLKLEENIVYEAYGYEQMLTAYVRYLHAGFATGGLSADDLEQWPLQQGLDRVVALRQLLGEPRTATSAMVLNFCAARDRFGEMHELKWLMEPPFGDPADSELHGGAEMGLLRLTDLYIYLVDAPKCKWLGDEVVQDLKRAARSVHLIPYTGGPSREEQTAYFKYLSDHYDDLPDFTIFVHPDAPEHQGSEFLSLRRALKLIHTRSALAHQALQYYPLAQQLVVEPKRTWGAEYAADWLEFWGHVFDRPWQSYDFGPPRCRWAAHPGAFLSGLAEGASEGVSRVEAKIACVAAGAGCLGVTCGTPSDAEERGPGQAAEGAGGAPGDGQRRGTCSARRGEGGSPIESPSPQETSFVKTCAEEGGSAHEDAVHLGALEEGSFRPVADFVEHPGMYLAGYAAGDAQERPRGASRARCEALGALCAGYTCDAVGALCTVREGAQPLRSPTGEVSFLKPPRARDAGGPDGRHPAPDRGPPDAVFQLYTGSQSVVHRDRIRAWPRERLAAMGADGPFCSRFSGFYEAVWHAMFGETLSQPAREQDPRVPLFLKWMVPTFYSYGDEGVI